MLKSISFFLQIIIAVAVLWGGYRLLFRERCNQAWRIAFAVLGLCAVFISFSVADMAQPMRIVTITATRSHNPAAESFELSLANISVNGNEVKPPEPVSGAWTWYKGDYRWFIPGDKRLEQDSVQTESITFRFPLVDSIDLLFRGNQWKGIAEIEVDGNTYTVDTYRPEGTVVRFSLPRTTNQALKAALSLTAFFTLSLLIFSALSCLVISVAQRIIVVQLERHSQNGVIQRLMSQQFLFEELVSRDFKKKYKRTVLGMAWSVLSPLLTLLVMRLVFTQFFGRSTPHYTTYLFCGNLVFSYFNESSSQGMTSLMSNAGIFTKVNVPKYMFLFSKNIQTLINFGLTLCVFFVFCVLDNITFTWKFVCLLFPILCLVLFNIGVGLILSALFVFFRDVQYLWSVFTQLLMYMSAIFYTIDKYPPITQNLFLLNPVYLFIRYFRKIVIEATIPTIWFHLLMLADVAIVMGIGCWMYKKYNHKFLYYV